MSLLRASPVLLLSWVPSVTSRGQGWSTSVPCLTWRASRVWGIQRLLDSSGGVPSLAAKNTSFWFSSRGKISEGLFSVLHGVCGKWRAVARARSRGRHGAGDTRVWGHGVPQRWPLLQAQNKQWLVFISELARAKETVSESSFCNFFFLFHVNFNASHGFLCFLLQTLQSWSIFEPPFDVPLFGMSPFNFLLLHLHLSMETKCMPLYCPIP